MTFLEKKNSSNSHNAHAVNPRASFSAFVLALGFLGACQTFETVEEACKDSVGGSKVPNNTEVVDVLRDYNCYRRMVRSGAASFYAPPQRAAENHANYVQMNLPEMTAAFRENPEHDGFTGVSVFERLGEEGFAYSATTNFAFQVSWVQEDPFEFENFAKNWMEDPFTASTLMLRSPIGAGLASAERDEENGQKSYIWQEVWLYDVPTGAYPDPILTYPAKGQTDVPASYRVSRGEDYFIEPGEYGTPILLSAGLHETVDEFLQGALIPIVEGEGEAQSVPFNVYYSKDMLNTTLSNFVIVMPIQPLTAGTEYIFSGKLKTDIAEESTFKTRFTPQAETVTLDLNARRAPSYTEILPLVRPNGK